MQFHERCDHEYKLLMHGFCNNILKNLAPKCKNYGNSLAKTISYNFLVNPN